MRRAIIEFLVFALMLFGLILLADQVRQGKLCRPSCAEYSVEIVEVPQ